MGRDVLHDLDQLRKRRERNPSVKPTLEDWLIMKALKQMLPTIQGWVFRKANELLVIGGASATTWFIEKGGTEDQAKAIWTGITTAALYILSLAFSRAAAKVAEK